MAAQTTRHTVVGSSEGPPLPRFDEGGEGDEGGVGGFTAAAAFVAAANAGDGAPNEVSNATIDGTAATAPRRKRSRPAESAARELEAEAEAEAERRAAAEALAAVERAEKAEASMCEFCGKMCGNPGSLKNHQKMCKAKRAAEEAAAAAAREKKRAARLAKQQAAAASAAASAASAAAAAAAADQEGPLPRAVEGELACGLCGKRCGNGGALARHVAVCTYKAGGGLPLAVAQRDATRAPDMPEPSHAQLSHGSRALVVRADNPPQPQRFDPMSAGAVADWLAGVHGGRYVAEFGGKITYHFADLTELMALARLTRLGIDNVLKRVGVERAGVRLVLTAAVRKLRDAPEGGASE